MGLESTGELGCEAPSYVSCMAPRDDELEPHQDARQEHSAPIIAALKQWFEKRLSMISSGSRLAEDIRYGLAHW